MTVEALLAAIVSLPPACSLESLVEVMGGQPWDLLTEAEESGLIEAWEAEQGPTVLLSPLGASRLGVALVEVGEKLWVWKPVGWEAPPLRSPMDYKAFELAMEAVEDPAPSALSAMIEDEWADRETRRVGRESAAATQAGPKIFKSRPNRLLGQTMIWRGPLRRPGACYVCAGRMLTSNEYCLLCDRYGSEHMLPRIVIIAAPVNIFVPSKARGPASKPKKALTRKERRAEARRAASPS